MIISNAITQPTASLCLLHIGQCWHAQKSLYNKTCILQVITYTGMNLIKSDLFHTHSFTLVNHSRPWDHGIIPYRISSEVPGRSAVLRM